MSSVIRPVDSEDQLTRELLRDLHRARPVLYRVDLAATATIGWLAFFFAIKLRPFSGGMVASFAVAVVGLYRGLCFLHELSHQNSRTLPGFDGAWNLLIGYPLLLPSFVYAGVHQYHHSPGTYGTSGDPEYLPFARSSRMTTVFALQSILIPIALAIRFLLLSWVGLFWERFQTWLVIHASALTMNPDYRRLATPQLTRRVRRHSLFILIYWALPVALATTKIIPWRSFVVWFGVSACISFLNTLRTLGAHGYESDGEPLDRAGQLADSIDTPGALWTELWAPVGLRYHALHHYFPGIPYHNLRRAWVRLAAGLPEDAGYHRVRSPGLAHSLRTLYRKGRRKRG